jgi:uncharacterized repeat protein (TIGR01451 family)
MRETPLAETRSVDDQIEWLDDRQVLYGTAGSSRTLYVADADGGSQPRRFLNQALSPAVLRTPLSAAALDGLASAPQLDVPGTDLGVHLATTQGPARVGETLAHTLKVTNYGSSAATSVVAEDVITGPGTVTAATADTPPGAAGHGCTVVAEENRVQCDVSELRAGAEWTITVTVTLKQAGTIAGHGLASAAQPDTQPDNDTATVSTAVQHD